MASRIEVKGLRELQASFKELPQKLHRRVLNYALMKGSKPMAAQAKSNISSLSMTIARNIRARPIKPEYSASVMLGVRKISGKALRAFKKKTGKAGKYNPNDPFFWRFWEFGFHDRGGKFHQRPFLRPAFEARKYESAKEIKNVLLERIEKEAKKMHKAIR